MQEFNKISTTSNLIKNLLATTYLPLIRTVRDFDYIIQDRLYVYKCNVIKCLKSGYIITGFENARDDRDRAEFEIKSEYFFGERNDKLCTNFVSSAAGYDYMTHERLGKYLRSLRDMYGLNLMPLYNCFSNQPFGNHHIYTDRVAQTQLDYATKIYKVPIRLNTDYTICMENLGLTTFAPAFIKHGNLLQVDNTRFGNGTDVTNKYIKLNENSVIIHKPNLRFTQPVKIRFDNIPITKKVQYTLQSEKPFDVVHNDAFYKQVIAKPGEHYYTREVDEFGIPTYSYYEYIPTLAPNDKLYPADDLYPTGGPDIVIYESINPSTGLFNSDKKEYEIVNLRYHCSELDDYDDTATYYILNHHKFEPYPVEREEYYLDESLYYLPGTLGLNPGEYYKLVNGKFVQCTSTDTFDMNTTYATLIDRKFAWKEQKDRYDVAEGLKEAVFNLHKTKYYIKVGDQYIQCTEESVFDPDQTYYTHSYYLDDTTDQWIVLEKTYYSRYPITSDYEYSYSITADNCALYDAMEDNLYLLIQVPSTFNSNIVVLEGDYTHMSSEKVYSVGSLENFPSPVMDFLFTANLKLMKVSSEVPIPFSDTLVEFLLWNAINPLDSINNDMDRLAVYIPLAMGESYAGSYFKNYWYAGYRKLVCEMGTKYNSNYIADNLGYVTKDIEKTIYNSPYLAEMLTSASTIEPSDEE